MDIENHLISSHGSCRFHGSCSRPVNMGKTALRRDLKIISIPSRCHFIFIYEHHDKNNPHACRLTSLNSPFCHRRWKITDTIDTFSLARPAYLIRAKLSFPVAMRAVSGVITLSALYGSSLIFVHTFSFMRVAVDFLFSSQPLNSSDSELF